LEIAGLLACAIDRKETSTYTAPDQRHAARDQKRICAGASSIGLIQLSCVLFKKLEYLCLFTNSDVGLTQALAALEPPLNKRFKLFVAQILQPTLVERQCRGTAPGQFSTCCVEFTRNASLLLSVPANGFTVVAGPKTDRNVLFFEHCPQVNGNTDAQIIPATALPEVRVSGQVRPALV
jgi:hypothetical protein